MSHGTVDIDALSASLDAAPQSFRDAPDRWLAHLVAQGLDHLPMPGHQTLQRWRALACVGAADLSLAKLYEGHTDALMIRDELGAAAVAPGSTWGVWAAESAGHRTLCEGERGSAQVRLSGRKNWCSGAGALSHALLTAWSPQGGGPQLVAVDLHQPNIEIDRSSWQAIGMGRSGSFDLTFHGARGTRVGEPGDYLSRVGFWQGGAGIAACWFGAAQALGDMLNEALRQSRREPDGFSLAALGRVDLALMSTAAILRDAARWIDQHPRANAQAVARRARLSAETSAQCVLDEASRALGAGALCRDARFARLATDLPVFLRQSHGARDFASLGAQVLGAARSQRSPWLGDDAWA